MNNLNKWCMLLLVIMAIGFAYWTQSEINEFKEEYINNRYDHYYNYDDRDTSPKGDKQCFTLE